MHTESTQGWMTCFMAKINKRNEYKTHFTQFNPEADTEEE